MAAVTSLQAPKRILCVLLCLVLIYVRNGIVYELVNL